MKDIESREDIELLVNSFYISVQQNEMLGYIFNDIAKVDWEKHLPKMFDFWETLIFHKAVYKGNPMKVHMLLHHIHQLKKEDFEEWFILFCETVDKLFNGENAELAKTRAQSVSTSIQLNTVYKKGDNT